VSWKVRPHRFGRRVHQRPELGAVLTSDLYFDRFKSMKLQEAVCALAALAQESRLAVFRLLVSRGPAGYPAGEIGERLAIPGPTLSFHLKELAQAGLITSRKEGRFIYYAPAFGRMNELLAYLTENCCSQGTLRATACAPPHTTSRKRRSA
jgi:ArsR family transcriptional regulator, arsenate/arsenite/antimonite-responsive transcriptional repressor